MSSHVLLGSGTTNTTRKNSCDHDNESQMCRTEVKVRLSGHSPQCDSVLLLINAAAAASKIKPDNIFQTSVDIGCLPGTNHITAET